MAWHSEAQDSWHVHVFWRQSLCNSCGSSFCEPQSTYDEHDDAKFVDGICYCICFTSFHFWCEIMYCCVMDSDVVIEARPWAQGRIFVALALASGPVALASALKWQDLDLDLRVVFASPSNSRCVLCMLIAALAVCLKVLTLTGLGTLWPWHPPPPYLHLATSEMWCWSGGRGI